MRRERIKGDIAMECKNKRKKSQVEVIERREMLRRLGRYSAAAAAVLVVPPSWILSGCSDDGSDGGILSDATSFGSAISLSDGSSYSQVSLSPGGQSSAYLKVTNTSAAPDEVTLTVSSLSSSGGLTIRIYDSDHEMIWENTIYSAPYGVNILLNTFESYSDVFIVFSRGEEGVTFSFRLDDTSTTSWENYSDWSDSYSDWIDSYSDWSDSYSDWSDSYSDWSNAWHHAYSDWSNAWGNWMQSW